MKLKNIELKYVVVDNDVHGKMAYCATEEVALSLIDALNALHGLDPQEEVEQNGYFRFGYEEEENTITPACLYAQQLAHVSK